MSKPVTYKIEYSSFEVYNVYIKKYLLWCIPYWAYKGCVLASSITRAKEKFLKNMEPTMTMEFKV